LEGLRIALANLDEVIALIKASENGEAARKGLVSRFELSEIQAQAILDMRLQRLTGLERDKIEIEFKELMEKIMDMKDILANKSRVFDIIKGDCAELRDKYGDDRKTELTVDFEELNMEDLIQEEKVIVFITKFGFIKRLAIDTFRSQLRGGRGIGGMVTREGDIIEKMFIVSTHSFLTCFTNTGRVYKTKVYNIPDESRYAKGISITNLIKMEAEEKVTAAVVVDDFDKKEFMVMTTINGVVKRIKLEDFKNIRTSGIIAIALDEGDELKWVEITDGNTEILLVSKTGMIIRFKEDQVRTTGRMARGVRGMQLKDGDVIVDNSVRPVDEEKAYLLMIAESGIGKRVHIKEFRLQKRAGLGLRGIKLKANDSISGAAIVNFDDEVMIVTEKGTVSRQSVNRISSQGRNARGVRVQKVDAGDKVVAFAKLLEAEEENNEI